MYTEVGGVEGCRLWQPPRSNLLPKGYAVIRVELVKSGLVSQKLQGAGPTAGPQAGARSALSRQYTRQRVTRVNLRDFIFYMEQERDTRHSLVLYRALLK
ncbi:hypothetical protein chiPu_0017893 [Chiloscyllium punctatum]|uniref:Transcription initiation factor TFIID component TAF4 C-terminal domain-containing protein n=1 Tax=Chiloscyllium punctatum TaxID=137246 RepID=A0A401RJP0_CHIPU|nr:hypothetical protein [Chiloscyllium punctatum]